MRKTNHHTLLELNGSLKLQDKEGATTLCLSTFLFLKTADVGGTAKFCCQLRMDHPTWTIFTAVSVRLTYISVCNGFLGAENPVDLFYKLET